MCGELEEFRKSTICAWAETVKPSVTAAIPQINVRMDSSTVVGSVGLYSRVILPESCVGANPTMPITVAEAFVAAGLSPGGSVTWGTKPTTLGNGVYIVSLTESLDSLDGALPRVPLSSIAQQFEASAQNADSALAID
jgi:hypothetical protein